MLVVVSPAKKLDMSSNAKKVKTSEPMFSDDINRLVKAAGQLSEESLQALMINAVSNRGNYVPFSRLNRSTPEECGTWCQHQFGLHTKTLRTT